MVEIEDRGLVFRSWKKYAEFQEIEIQKLQQMLNPNTVKMSFNGAIREFKRDNPKYWNK